MQFPTPLIPDKYRLPIASAKTLYGHGNVSEMCVSECCMKRIISHAVRWYGVEFPQAFTSWSWGWGLGFGGGGGGGGEGGVVVVVVGVGVAVQKCFRPI